MRLIKNETDLNCRIGAGRHLYVNEAICSIIREISVNPVLVIDGYPYKQLQNVSTELTDKLRSNKENKQRSLLD